MLRLPDVTDAPSFWAVLAHQRGRVAFDVGANIGQAAAALAPNFERVISFEPCDESATILRSLAAPNVTVVAAAVSAHVGAVRLDETANSIRTGQLTTGSKLGWGDVIGSREVDATTLDQATGVYGTPDLVKVDVEGHELQVLDGAPLLLAARSATWLIEVHDRTHETPLLDMLDGYRTRRIDHDYLIGHPDAADHFYLEAVPCA